MLLAIIGSIFLCSCGGDDLNKKYSIESENYIAIENDLKAQLVKFFDLCHQVRVLRADDAAAKNWAEFSRSLDAQRNDVDKSLADTGLTVNKAVDLAEDRVTNFANFARRPALELKKILDASLESTCGGEAALVLVEPLRIILKTIVTALDSLPSDLVEISDNHTLSYILAGVFACMRYYLDKNLFESLFVSVGNSFFSEEEKPYFLASQACAPAWWGPSIGLALKSGDKFELVYCLPTSVVTRVGTAQSFIGQLLSKTVPFDPSGQRYQRKTINDEVKNFFSKLGLEFAVFVKNRT